MRDAGVACDARLRRVSRTRRITYHGADASLITYYDYEILPYDEDSPVDYIIDLDTYLVIKPK